MVVVKVRIQDCDDLRRFSIPENASFLELCRLLEGIYPQVNGLLETYLIRYADDEGDLTTITSDVELKEAIAFASVLTPPVLRLTLMGRASFDRSLHQSIIRFQGQELKPPAVIVPQNYGPVKKQQEASAPASAPVPVPEPSKPKPSLAIPVTPQETQTEPIRNSPSRFQTIIADLSDDMARKSLEESQSVSEATQKLGNERAKEFDDFANSFSAQLSTLILQNKSNDTDTKPLQAALDGLFVDTVNLCDSLNKSLRVQTKAQLDIIHQTLAQDDVDRKRLQELCETTIKKNYDLASSVLCETKQHSQDVLNIASSISTN